MQLTRAADYAIRVMLHLAALPGGVCATRAELAKSAEVSPAFVAKILHRLTRIGLVTSYAGRGGGFELGRPASEISILDIVDAIDQPICLNQCTGPVSHCHRYTWCPAHPVWVDAQAALRAVLGAASLDRLVAGTVRRQGIGAPVHDDGARGSSRACTTGGVA